MAAPSYTTDLATIDLAEASTNWSEPTASGWTLGAAPGTADVENFIQSSNSVPKAFNATGVGGLIANFGSGITIPTNGAFLGWVFWASPQTLDTEANGGIRFISGSGTAAFYAWKVGGKDTYAYGGWVNLAVDPTVTPDYTLGSPTATRQYFGWAVNNLNSITKGSPMVTDAFRYGRCEARMNGGETSNYATFAGYAATNDTAANRWGLIQEFNGSYQVKGLVVLGYSSAVDFRDSNRVLVIQNTNKVSASFNGFEVRNASSNVEWTNISIQALGTVSPGYFTAVDNATIVKTGCNFANMGAFTYNTNTTITTTIWRGCGQIIAAGASITNSDISSFSGASNTSALVWGVGTDPDGLLDDNTFTKGSGTTHGLELGTNSPLTVTLRNITFSGYNASDGQNDSALYVKHTAGIVYVNIVGGSTPSYKSDGATVNFVLNTVTVLLTAQTPDGTAVASASVFLATSDNTGPFPYQEVVTSIVNVITLATVTHTSHGMFTGDKVLIQGASHEANNGVFDITFLTTNTYSYVMSSNPGSSPTGTITSTYVILKGTTNESGQLSMSRVFSSNQPFEGWVRKSTSSPYYKTGLVTGTVSSSTGASPIALMILDE